MFMPGLVIFSIDYIEAGKPAKTSTFVDDKLAFWNVLKPPLQTVFEYEDVSGVLYRQYGKMRQVTVPSGAFHSFDVVELGKPYRVKERIVRDDTPASWIVPIPQ